MDSNIRMDINLGWILVIRLIFRIGKTLKISLMAPVKDGARAIIVEVIAMVVVVMEEVAVTEEIAMVEEDTVAIVMVEEMVMEEVITMEVQTMAAQIMVDTETIIFKVIHIIKITGAYADRYKTHTTQYDALKEKTK